MHRESAEALRVSRANHKCCCVCPHALCAQYTFILGASKNLPSQVVDFRKGKTRQRKSVGVRMPDDPVCKVRHLHATVTSPYV
jgi:tRNA A37 threonylcarbamoyladenosine synthetase subunit TsaC/SUA5/YrdC